MCLHPAFADSQKSAVYIRKKTEVSCFFLIFPDSESYAKHSFYIRLEV